MLVAAEAVRADDSTLAFARRKSPGMRHRFSPLFISPLGAVTVSRGRNAISENRVAPHLFRSFHQARNSPPRLRAFRWSHSPQSPPFTHRQNRTNDNPVLPKDYRFSISIPNKSLSYKPIDTSQPPSFSSEMQSNISRCALPVSSILNPNE